jgi:hypothetical protein
VLSLGLSHPPFSKALEPHRILARVVRAQLVLGAAASVLVLAACGGGVKPASATRPDAARPTTSTVTVAVHPSPPKPKPALPSHPHVLPSAFATSSTTGFVPAVNWHGQTVSWIARTGSGVTMLAFDQPALELHLHAGAADEGAVGWRYGPAVARGELPRIAAAFNGGFKFSTNPGGFESYGRTAVPLRAGLGSVVTYADGFTDIGSWNQEVPSHGRAVVSVRQNLPLLIDHGHAAATVGCVSCWGATLGGVVDPARSALGITAGGRLVWAGGEHLTVGALAEALLGAHVVRAVELDINPEWVAAYLYRHRSARGQPHPTPAVLGQPGIPGQFLVPWSRDFFVIVAR